ncbi:MAG TPA: DUF1549 domain-containing protein [Pirellulaceae bacterium]|nr:DUF1549 domain-containing protein [Pirellulaceae bacterium]
MIHSRSTPLLRRPLLALGMPLLLLLALTPVRPLSAQESETTDAPSTAMPSDEASSASAERLWNEHVRPLFEARCRDCHGSAKQEGGVDLRSAAAILAGGDSGELLDRTTPGASTLLRVLLADAETRMPPDGPPLTEDERLYVSRWLEAVAAAGDDPSWAAAADAAAPLPWEYDPSTLPGPDQDPTTVIDRLLADAWSRDGIVPAEPADDRTFVRRLYLDLVGRIPTVDETDSFLAADPATRRAERIALLTDSREHAEHLARIFDVVFQGRRSFGQLGRRQGGGRRGGGRGEGNGGGESPWSEFLIRAFETNRPWNETVRAIVLARPTDEIDRGATGFLHAKNDRYQEIAEALSPAVFGVQIQCAQCHDHPLASEIGQRHYWGLVAFFNRGKAENSPQGPAVPESAIGGFSTFADLSGKSQPNLLEFLGRPPVEEPRPEDPNATQPDAPELYDDPVGIDGVGEGMPKVPKFSRRQKFADEVLAGHPLVARAMVNRIWALLMGRGIVHPVDKLDSTHPPAHPELLSWLSRDFETHGYDVRRLVRAIAASRAYALGSRRPSPETAPSSFAWSLERPLSAETLARSLAVGLNGEPGEPIPGLERPLIETFPDLFPEEIVTTLPQAMFLTNHPEFNAALRPADGNLTREALDLPEVEARVALLYARLLGRPPADEERAVAIGFLQSHPDRPEIAMTSLVWSLVTSAEFRFNH